MGHNVGKAAENAVNRGGKKEVVTRTPAQILKDIRNNLAAKFAVTPLDVQFLLVAYDELVVIHDAAAEVLEIKATTIEALQRENESFREENRSLREAVALATKSIADTIKFEENLLDKVSHPGVVSQP